MALMDSDERQRLFDSLVDFYLDTFRPMSDEQRTLWFLTMNESVLQGFCVGEGQPIAEAEQKHAVKLLAIAHALAGLPCCNAERAAIDQLLKMGIAAQERAEKAGLKMCSWPKQEGRMIAQRFDSVWDAIEGTAEEAEAMKQRSGLMIGLRKYIAQTGMTNADAATLLRVSVSQVSDLVGGRFDQFTLSELVEMASVALVNCPPWLDGVKDA